jgi:hypothetical protein
MIIVIINLKEETAMGSESDEAIILDTIHVCIDEKGTTVECNVYGNKTVVNGKTQYSLSGISTNIDSINSELIISAAANGVSVIDVIGTTSTKALGTLGNSAAFELALIDFIKDFSKGTTSDQIASGANLALVTIARGAMYIGLYSFLAGNIGLGIAASAAAIGSTLVSVGLSIFKEYFPDEFEAFADALSDAADYVANKMRILSMKMNNIFFNTPTSEDPLSFLLQATLEELSGNVEKAIMGYIDPLVLDLNGDKAISFVDFYRSKALFDLTGDGIVEHTAWIESGDGMLFFDKNNNGKVDNIGELFGSDKVDGFTDLRDRMDSNNDGVIDKNDKNFDKLQIWQDFNQDGSTQRDELFTLNELGITEIRTTNKEANDNSEITRVTHEGTFVRNNEEHYIANVDFEYCPITANSAVDNTIKGDLQDDIFLFHKNDSKDIIADNEENDAKEVKKEDITFYTNGNDLVINYFDNDSVTISNHANQSYQIESIYLYDGNYLTSNDINRIIQDMNSYIIDDGISIDNIHNSIKNNDEFMQIVMGDWK